MNVFVLGKHGFLGRNILAQCDEGRDVLINCAGVVGGMLANREMPVEFLQGNIEASFKALTTAFEKKIPKVVMVGSSCSYPGTCAVPYYEDGLWDGPPHESNFFYGVSKRVGIEAGRAYRKQYGLNVVSVLLPNLYGPGQNSDPDTCHVIGALIQKVLAAKTQGKREVKMLGTGKGRREFLFIDDAVDAVLWAAKNYDQEEPINMGSGVEGSIKDLAQLIQDILGYDGEFVWGDPQDDGQLRKIMDSSKAHKLGWSAKTSLRRGLEMTIGAFLDKVERVGV